MTAERAGNMNNTDLDQFITTKMPHFIAINYRRLLEAQTSQEQVELALYTYDLGLRALTLGLVSQYLTRDLDKVSDPQLNELLLHKFSEQMTLDIWHKLLFVSLKAYEGKPDRFFMPELYEFHWDTSTLPHSRRVEVEQPFLRLTQIVMEVKTPRFRPQDEAEWDKLAKEAMGLLRQVLRDVAFIGRYDLIRILDYNNSFYDFELHKGFEISTQRHPLPRHTKLERGCFYFRKGAEEFLRLHPLLIPWEREYQGSELMPADTGIYDSFTYQRLHYLLASLGKRVVDDKSITTFVHLVFDTIEEVKRQRQEAERLTWWQLRDICMDITQGRMATMRHKYRRELYLQREETRNAFWRFIDSDKRCFVLIGKSGVGKSNFLWALGEELHQSRSDVCVLMYDGAHLKVAPSVTEFISQDFQDRLVMTGRQMQEVWGEIARVEGIGRRLVLLCVDAINENPQAKELLRQLDQLVQKPWPWLRVVFSSRPETWYMIKRGVRLSEALYYQEEGSRTLEVELEPFSYSERMVPFSRQELPDAYAKHRQVFKLQTSYKDLRGELRELLREPLNLWLVASTYAEQAIPDTLKVTDLIEQYVDALLRSERLHEEDLRFLEEQLVPLMVREGNYSNAITAAEIDAAGGGLREAVYSEQVLSDGRRMNESFTNLCDTEILVRAVKGREQKIAFKYERFYEYFVGKALFEGLGPKDSWERQYRKWITALPKSPFLWGAVKSCLQKQMRELPAEECAMLCVRLSRIGSQRMEEILIAALTDYGSNDPEKAEIILENMIEQERRWLRPILRRETASEQCPAWKRIGIDVASKLGMSRLVGFALTDPSSAVRAVAIRHAFIYWRREPEHGFALLENLMDRSIGFLGLPIPQILEPSVGLSLLILFDDFRNEETTARLRGMWSRAIERLLRVNPERLGGRRERLKGWIRTALLRTATGFAVRTASEVSSHSMLSVPEMKEFFKQDEDLERRRAVARKLVQYIDVTNDIRDLRNDFLALVAERDMFLSWLAFIVLKRHALVDQEIVLPLLKELFDHAIETGPPTTFSILLPVAIPLNQGFVSDEGRALYRHMVITYLDRFQGKWQSNLRTRRFSFLEGFGFTELGGIADAPLAPIARRYVEKMIGDKDYVWMKDIIEWEVTVYAVQAGYLRFVFSVLEMAINVEDPYIREAIIEVLARARNYHPNEVDDFMEVMGMDEQFTRAVRMRAPSETIGDLVDLMALQFFDEAIFLVGSQRLWQKLVWLFGQLPECRSLEQWLATLLKVAVNEVYGDSVFIDIPT